MTCFSCIRLKSTTKMCFDAITFNQDEPYMKPGLAEMKNAIVVPHIASASKVILCFIPH